MKYLRWFIRNMKTFAWSVAASVACHIVGVAIAMGFVMVSKTLVDLAIKGASSREIILWGAAMIVIIVVRDLMRALQAYIQTEAVARMKNALRQRHFDDLLHMNGELRSHFHSGDVLNRLESDVDTLATACCMTIPNMLGALLQFIAAFAYLLFLAPGLAWILAAILPLGVLGGRYVMHRVRKYTLAVKENDSQVQAHVQESIQNQTLIKTLEHDQVSSLTLTDLQDSLYGHVMKRTKFSLCARVLMSLTLALGHAVAFLWGVFGILHGSVTYGMMTAFLQLVNQLQRPVMEMSRELPTLFHSTASIDRLCELEQLPKEALSEPHMLEGIAGVRVTGVRFSYPGGKADVLKDFSHSFEPGSRTALIGPTGVGKSTLMKLLLSLLVPEEGSVELYNGSESVPASGATRCNFAYVPQGNSLFSGSIRENLLMGKPDANDEELISALHTAAADFVTELPKGMDSPCFEAGGGLSEGQAQRIAIARGLLRPGSILLLDEFSSALDNETENTLLERLTSEMTGKTMIFITHREKITEFCDSVLRLG